jgi:hypothetical protein
MDYLINEIKNPADRRHIPRPDCAIRQTGEESTEEPGRDVIRTDLSTGEGKE